MLVKAFALFCCTLIACSDASKPGAPAPFTPGRPAQLVPITFPATARVTSAQQILMRVADSGGRSVPGTLLTWSVVSGGGAFTPASSTADDNGLVTTTYALGETAGPLRVRATFASGGTQDFDLKALPGPLAELTPLYTDLSLRVGSSFSGTVRAVDGFGNGIPGVVLTSRAGDIQYTGVATAPTEPATATTDANGNATFHGTVGGLPGLQSFLIDGPEVGTDAGPASAFFAWFRVRASADQGYITPSLHQAFTYSLGIGATIDVDVVVIQADGTPAAQVPVSFIVAAADGSIVDANGNATSSATRLTDNYTGFAAVKWHVPVTPGTYTISASTAPPNDGRSPLVITAVCTRPCTPPACSVTRTSAPITICRRFRSAGGWRTIRRRAGCG